MLETRREYIEIRIERRSALIDKAGVKRVRNYFNTAGCKGILAAAYPELLDGNDYCGLLHAEAVRYILVKGG